jgi:hypothetical protein
MSKRADVGEREQANPLEVAQVGMDLAALGIDGRSYEAYALKHAAECCERVYVLPEGPPVAWERERMAGASIPGDELPPVPVCEPERIRCQMRPGHQGKHIALWKGKRYEWE